MNPIIDCLNGIIWPFAFLGWILFLTEKISHMILVYNYSVLANSIIAVTREAFAAIGEINEYIKVDASKK